MKGSKGNKLTIMSSLNDHLANLSLDTLESLFRVAVRVHNEGYAPSPSTAYSRLAIQYRVSSHTLAIAVTVALVNANNALDTSDEFPED